MEKGKKRKTGKAKEGMRMKKTGTKHASIVSICVLFLLVATAILITACANGKREDHVDANGTMNIDFGEDGMIRNGTAYDTYQVEEGQKGIISIRVSKISGRLDIDVYQVDSKDTPNYTGRDLDSASFDVIVEEPGEYKVCFTATEFVGDYEINWRTEDKAMPEVCSPGDMQSPDYECGIWVPICKLEEEKEYEAADIVSTMMVTGIL